MWSDASKNSIMYLIYVLDHRKSKRIPEKHLFLLYWLCQSLWLCRSTNCGKFFKRWKYQPILPASWKVYMQVKKQQSEPDTEQWTGFKLENGLVSNWEKYIKAVYCHPAYLSISCKMLDWMMQNLEPRLPGEISITSDMGFPGGSEGKVGDLVSIPELGRYPGEGNGNPLQYSCLENPMDRGVWWATVHGVTKIRTRLSNFTFTFTFRYEHDTTFMAESEEKLKSLLIKWKRRMKKLAENSTLRKVRSKKKKKKKSKIIASGPITSWQIDGETMEIVTDFVFLGSKITADGNCS